MPSTTWPGVWSVWPSGWPRSTTHPAGSPPTWFARAVVGDPGGGGYANDSAGGGYATGEAGGGYATGSAGGGYARGEAGGGYATGDAGGAWFREACEAASEAGEPAPIGCAS
ncbi:hypothetical protein BN970_02406 [Mycolicibacterium conceptionense]|uniref:Uncharacterized protein n=1 Tax=Mycolicibacterium conceptionense TaxID=451644 RepID=A0A0U1DCP9_9MYCO|nr:hypothetical protein AWB98_17260 [Mycolicibacterium conceptionense]CQD11831.1 hypothetical protein BN970_02406 [Mycolicibacterium conceptionense]